MKGTFTVRQRLSHIPQVVAFAPSHMSIVQLPSLLGTSHLIESFFDIMKLDLDILVESAFHLGTLSSDKDTHKQNLPLHHPHPSPCFHLDRLNTVSPIFHNHNPRHKLFLQPSGAPGRAFLVHVRAAGGDEAVE